MTTSPRPTPLADAITRMPGLSPVERDFRCAKAIATLADFERDRAELMEALRKCADMAEALDEPAKITSLARALLSRLT